MTDISSQVHASLLVEKINTAIIESEDAVRAAGGTPEPGTVIMALVGHLAGVIRSMPDRPTRRKVRKHIDDILDTMSRKGA